MNYFYITMLALVMATATAHMGLEPPLAVAGARTIVTVRVGHDCGDETVGTTNFTIVLPPRMSSVTVELMPHWRVLLHKKNYTMEVENANGTMEAVEEEYIHAVTYLGFLPDHFYQHFNIRIKMPETIGEVLWFKGYQDCHNQGTSIAWEAIPSASDPSPRYPARNITIVKTLDDLAP